jgi:aromatic ring-opening dioxygenase LigB subunit
MAKVVLGFASSHGPTIKTLPGEWDRIVERDKKDPRYDYQELLRNASPAIAQEITLQKKQERYDRCQVAIKKLADVVVQSKPDVAVVLSNPHGILPDDPLTVFGIFSGDLLSSRSAERSEGGSERSIAALTGPPPVATSRPRREKRQFPGFPKLASHLIDSLIDEGFDIASSNQFRAEHGLDEAFSTFYELYQTDGTVPMVPFSLSRYLPSQATSGRCYALGQALRRAIESWKEDKRVVIMASGGLSHQIIDEELDQQVIHALKEKDVQQLCSLPRDRLNRGPGTPEILNWVALAGAMESSTMTLVDYVPCYRSAAGTGHGVTFAYWG